jgi:hypothetical protein
MNDTHNVGLAAAWILDGMEQTACLTTIDDEPSVPDQSA